MDKYTFRHLRGWGRQAFYVTRAWVDLMNGERDVKAANSLFRLNRLTKHDFAVRSTYDMKNHLVRIFYKKGYCIRAVKSEQTLECWHTKGYQEGWARVCPKCGNTGVFARHELYKFTFVIGGQHFTWHQPGRLVDWDVEITGAPVVYEGKEPEEIEITQERKLLDQAILFVYLRMAGIPNEKIMQPPASGLRDALRWDGEQLWRDFKHLVKRLARGNSRFAQTIRLWSDDWIPF